VVHEFLREEQGSQPPAGFYLSWVAMVAGAKMLLGSRWTHGLVTLNWFAFAVACHLVLRGILRLTA
jgi:hypothetical protein